MEVAPIAPVTSPPKVPEKLVAVEAEVAANAPVPSRKTMVLAVLAVVAVVAEFATFPAVEMIARFASVIPAVPERFAFVNPVIILEPAAIVLFVNV